jgi:outer membrane protein assembly factor BamB
MMLRKKPFYDSSFCYISILTIIHSGYVVATNYGMSQWTLVDGTQITNGAFGAINLQTGAPIWQTAMPDLLVSNVSPSIVGDLMIAGTGYDNNGLVGGSLIAMNKKTGEILMNYQLDVVFHGAISFANEYMFVSDGYRGPNVSFPSTSFLNDLDC